jgi:hypothetical protein
VACLSFSDSRRADGIHKAAARRGRAAAFLAAGLAGVLVVALVAGCDRGRLAYANDQYRFALTYDAALAPTDRAVPAALTGERPAYVIAFLDTEAPRASGRYVDGVWVAVMRLPANARWPDPSAMAAELRRRLAASVAGSLTGPVAQTTTRQIGGLPAWAVGYDYRLGGTVVRALTYVLVKGDYEYQVTLQAAVTRWPGMLPRLAESVDSFTVR